MRRNILIGCGALGALVLVVLLIVLVLAVVNGGSNKTTSTGSSSSSPSGSSGKYATDTSNQEFAVGDTATMTDRTFRVNEEEPNYVSPNQFTKPQSGNKFVRVNVTITNTSNNQISFNPNDFKLQDANGVQRNYRVDSSMPNALNSGNLAANGSVTGNLLFEPQQGATGLKLVYKPNAFRSETVTVNL